MTSAVLLVERTAEALLMTSDNCWKTSDIPFYFYLFIFYYDVIPSRHLSSYFPSSHFHFIYYFIVRLRDI
jgi:hypothetical protein